MLCKVIKELRYDGIVYPVGSELELPDNIGLEGYIQILTKNGKQTNNLEKDDKKGGFK